METLLALVVGVLLALGVFLVLERSLLRFVFGLILVSNAVNLLVFAAGRVAGRTPPLLVDGARAADFANPVPQALVLTAIVIGFGLVAFTLTLVARGGAALGTLDADELSATAGLDQADDDDGAGRAAPAPHRPARPRALSSREVTA